MFSKNHPLHKSSVSPSYEVPYLNGYSKNRHFPNATQVIKDYGPEPFVLDIEKATLANDTFRTTVWTGTYLQLTLMSLAQNESIGLEVHDYLDQFVRIEDGVGLVMMGPSATNLSFTQEVKSGDAFIIPAGTWHNLVNIDTSPLKLYSLYAPIEHPYQTIHVTKADALAADEHHSSSSPSPQSN